MEQHKQFERYVRTRWSSCRVSRPVRFHLLLQSLRNTIPILPVPRAPQVGPCPMRPAQPRRLSQRRQRTLSLSHLPALPSTSAIWESAELKDLAPFRPLHLPQLRIRPLPDLTCRAHSISNNSHLPPHSRATPLGVHRSSVSVSSSSSC
jgi:hypothetical protein